MAEYHPISAKDPSRLHQFGPKSALPGIFLGYALHAGRIWKGTVKLSGGDQVLRTSTLIRDRPDKEKNKVSFKENQTDLLQPHIKTHRCMMVKLEMISGPFQATLFTVIKLNPESNCTCREKHHSLFH